MIFEFVVDYASLETVFKIMVKNKCMNNPIQVL